MPQFYMSGHTVGVELETTGIPQSTLSRIVSANFDRGWRIVHDASIESPGGYNGVGIYFILPRSNERRLNIQSDGATIGGEIVSPVLAGDRLEIYNLYDILTDKLHQAGEPEINSRSSVHVHVSFPSPSLEQMKAALRVAAYFENLFFYLGTNGYTFRGETNSAIYCRPITGKGPCCVPVGGNKFAQIFNLQDLYSAANVEEFWDRFGDARNKDGHYQPVRYHWFNLFPTYPGGSYKGTLEIRIWNETLNPDRIATAVEITRAFARIVYKYAYDQELFSVENSILGNNPSPSELITLLNRFSEMGHLTNKDYYVAESILNLAPPVNIPNNYVFTHKTDTGRFFTGSYSPSKIPNNQIVIPTWVDSHNY